MSTLVLDPSSGAPLPPHRVAHRPPLWWVLIRHEWRLTIRGFGSFSRGGSAGKDAKPKKRLGRKRFIFNIVAAAVLLHLVGLIATLALPRHWSDSGPQRMAAAVVMLLLFTLMLSAAMSRIVSAFHERRDLDLLLAAPISPMLILAIRAITVIVVVTMMFAIFIYPIADVGVATRHWWMARLYPLVLLMATLTTAIALLLTGALVRLIGIRRARVGLQIFSALVGASFYLLSQAQNFFPIGLRLRVMSWFVGAVRSDSQMGPIGYLTRIAAGDPWAWFAFAIGSVGLFVVALWFTRKRFFEIAQTPEAEARVTAPVRAKVERRIARSFSGSPFTTLVSKEWRLILRAPQLLSQILLQLLYLLPLLFFAFTRDEGRMSWSGPAAAAGVVGLAATLATSLAWLTVSAEDAADLLAGSPRSRALILWSKLIAATLPPMAIVTMIAIGTMRRSVPDAMIVWVFGVLACVSAAILAAAVPTSGKRSDFQRRHRGRGLFAFVEAFQFLLWSGAAGAAAGSFWLVAAGLTVLACVMPAIYLPRALRNVNVVSQ